MKIQTARFKQVQKDLSNSIKKLHWNEQMQYNLNVGEGLDDMNDVPEGVKFDIKVNLRKGNVEGDKLYGGELKASDITTNKSITSVKFKEKFDRGMMVIYIMEVIYGILKKY